MEPGSVGAAPSSAMNELRTAQTDPNPWRTTRRHARKPRINLPYADLIKPRTDTVSLGPRYWRPGAVCPICGEPIRMWQQYNWDHQVPMSQGGARGRKNKYLAHMLCNSVKGNTYPFSLRTPADRAALRARVKPALYARLERVWRGEAG
jgi:hypothetical protein